MELDQEVLELALNDNTPFKSFEDLKVVLVAIRLKKVRNAEWKDYLCLENFKQAFNCFSNEVKLLLNLCLFALIND